MNTQDGYLVMLFVVACILLYGMFRIEEDEGDE